MLKNKNKVGKKVLLIFWLAWMIMIFWFSSKPAAESTHESLRVGRLVCNVVVPGYGKMAAAQQYDYAASIDHFVRKSAHFTEYALLGMLTLLVWKKRDKVLQPWLWCILYASSDEMHQLFVPGRSGMWQDVLLDSMGALTGICLLLGVKKIIRYYNLKKH